MVARDAPDLNDNVSEEAITNGESLSARIFNNAEIEIPECRKQLLVAKDDMSSTADMYQQDYLDKVERRSDLTIEAKEKAVLCLLDVSKKIYDLAGCFQRLIEDQADKLEEIENMTLTASASLEIASCQKFRHDLLSKLPPSNVPTRLPRIGRPDAMQTEFYSENVTWERLNYNKLDSIGVGGIGSMDEGENFYMDMPTASNVVSDTASQHSINSLGSSRSQITQGSSNSPILQNHLKPQNNDSRLTASSVDVSRDPNGSLLNRCGSITSLSSMTSTKSLRILPARAAPAPPPSKTKPHRPRVYSVKNETGEGLEKPSIPAPRPPAGDEEHYAIPPSRMPTVSEEDKDSRGTPIPEVIYDQARAGAMPPPALLLPAQPLSQYQQIAIETPPPIIPPSPAYDDDDDIYTDMDDLYDAPRSRNNSATPLHMSPLGTPSPRKFDNPLSGIFGRAKSPITLSYTYKRQGSAPFLAVSEPTIQEDSDSEFEDRDDLEDPGDIYVEAEGTIVPGGTPDDIYIDAMDDDDIYQDVEGIYDAPPSVNRTPTNTPGGADAHQEADDDMYIDNELLPPPPSDIMPPPPPDDLYMDNTVDPLEIVNSNTVSVSKDSGFYTEDQEEDDPIIATVRAIYPYAATASDELNIVVGDVIMVHVKNPDGWFEGTLNGHRGLFPGNYVQPME